MVQLPNSIQAAIDNAEEEDTVRSAEGRLLALSNCTRHCAQCEGVDHHWMPECDDDGNPVMVCKHCPAWREPREDDF